MMELTRVRLSTRHTSDKEWVCDPHRASGRPDRDPVGATECESPPSSYVINQKYVTPAGHRQWSNCPELE